jgi:hypothetical protein
MRVLPIPRFDTETETVILITLFNCIERIVLLDFIHRLVSQEQTKLRN